MTGMTLPAVTHAEGLCSEITLESVYAQGTLCVQDDERKHNSVSVMEEGFGKADSPNNDGNVRICYRATITKSCKEEMGKDKLTLKVDKDFSALVKKCPGNEYKCQKVTVLLGQGGVSLIQTYVGMIYRWAATMAGIVCVLIMIVSGIQITASGGDTTGVEAARKRITQSLMALAVLFLSAVILYMINPNFFTR